MAGQFVGRKEEERKEREERIRETRGEVGLSWWWCEDEWIWRSERAAWKYDGITNDSSLQVIMWRACNSSMVLRGSSIEFLFTLNKYVSELTPQRPSLPNLCT